MTTGPQMGVHPPPQTPRPAPATSVPPSSSYLRPSLCFSQTLFPKHPILPPPLLTVSSVISPRKVSMTSLFNTSHSLSTSASFVPGTRARCLKLLDRGTGLVSFTAGQVTQPLAHSRYSVNANRLTSRPLTLTPRYWCLGRSWGQKTQQPSHQHPAPTSPWSHPSGTRASLPRDSGKDRGPPRATPQPLPAFTEH